MEIPKMPLISVRVTYGADPEIFLKTSGGQIIGSEHVISESGLVNRASFPVGPLNGPPPATGLERLGSIHQDGVQVDLHPCPTNCRANFGNYIQACFRTLRDELKKHKGVLTDFSQVVEVDRLELEKLNEKARFLGCLPSENVYGRACLKIDGMNYLKRSAAGHIHLSWDRSDYQIPPEDLVKTLDILVGNTCVLIDRDPGAVERRKLYGRAGEYRLPPYGIEYRTLSNFWLRAYPLLSLVLGLCNTAVSAAYSKILPELTCNVSMKNIEEAINTNNYDLALDNFGKAVIPFLENHSGSIYKGIYHQNLPDFLYFSKKIAEKGIEYWFPEDPLMHWCEKPEGHQHGWEAFASNVIFPERISTGPAREG